MILNDNAVIQLCVNERGGRRTDCPTPGNPRETCMLRGAIIDEFVKGGACLGPLGQAGLDEFVSHCTASGAVDDMRDPSITGGFATQADAH